MVTARVDESDRLLGFDAGADDYLCKPFSAREMVARVQAQLRRSRPAARVPPQPLRMDADQQRAYWKETRLSLTAQQFRLLQVLAAQPGRIFSRAQLLEQAFPPGAQLFDRAIDSQIKNLRKKLAADIPGEDIIHSVYGVGYRFEYASLPK
jgi:two-component system, OmpR family, response regulator BaeR